MKAVLTSTLRNLAGSPQSLFAIVPWFILAGITAHSAHGATLPLVLLGRVAVPIVVFAAFRLHLPDLDARARSWLLLGISRRDAAAALLLVVAATTAVPLAALGALVATRFHGAGDPPALRDALTVAAILFVEACVYVAIFGAASSFHKGRAATFVLFADLFVGGLPLFRLVSPRAHAASLLGAANVLHLPPRLSSIVLVLFGAVGAAILHWRFRPLSAKR